MALGSAGRFACVYIPSTFFVSTPRVHTPRARPREREKVEREAAGVELEATHTPHRHVHTRGLTSCATETRLCVFEEETQYLPCLLLRRYCVSFFEDTVYSKIPCIRRYCVRRGSQEAAHQPSARPREHWSRWMERGATGGGGDRCAPLAPAAPKLTRLIRANSLTTTGSSQY